MLNQNGKLFYIDKETGIKYLYGTFTVNNNKLLFKRDLTYDYCYAYSITDNKFYNQYSGKEFIIKDFFPNYKHIFNCEHLGILILLNPGDTDMLEIKKYKGSSLDEIITYLINKGEI